MTDVQDYNMAAIALYEGASSAGSLTHPQEPLAVIPQADFNALWREIGIDVDSWSPDVRQQENGFRYPQIYAIQNYIVYEHECRFDEVDGLLSEAAGAGQELSSPEAKRALVVLVRVATQMRSEGHGIVFRPAIISPLETQVGGQNEPAA